MKRYFLNHDKPAIDSTIEKLFELYAQTSSGEWNLSRVLLVVPSARIRRELLYQLILFAQDKNVVLEIPKIVTIGRAPEFLYRQTRPFADDVTQNLAWFRAIKTSDEDKRKEYLPSMPDDDDLEGQFQLGLMFSRLHLSLSAEMLNFHDETPKSDRNIVNELEKFQNSHGGLNLSKEIDRWKYFSEIKKKYLSILDESNLWDVQVARRYALASPQPGDFQTDFDIILAGIVDLNRVQKAILQKVSNRVTVFVYSSETESAGFDDFGALIADYWTRDLLCPLSDSQIVQVEKPEEQVLCAFDFIGHYSSQYTPDQITIGVPDDNMVPFIQAAAEKLGILIDNVVGEPISSTEPYALLKAIADFLEFGSYSSFAKLVRHPAVYSMISQNVTGTKKEILSILDRFQDEYFPLNASSSVIKKLEPTLSCSVQEISMVRVVLSSVRDWLSDLLKRELNPNDMGKIITKLFKRLPEEKSRLNLNAEALIINSCEKLDNISENFAKSMSPRSALQLILMRLESYNLPNGSEYIDTPEDELDQYAQKESSQPMIHLAGWLELVWDRAPVLAILSLNEGVVPQSINAHLFLPNELRKELGILDNNRRFARDAYALKTMADSKSKERLLAVFSKYDTKGKATLPSRLLFDKDRYIRQANVFFNDETQLIKYALDNPASVGTIPALSSRSEVYQWAEKNLSGNVLKGAVTSISATKFKDYIACPFRFYLNHVAKVQPTDYSINELPESSFGTIIHHVLNEWAQKELESGRNNWRPDSDSLSSELNNLVDKYFEQRFPKSVLPGIVIQKEIIKQRLKAFAAFQRSWEGNVIAVEKDFEQVVSLKDNEKMTLIGRIDRIDLLPNGDIVLLDYKTSGKGKNPQKDHLEDDSWINLQLPIYRQVFLANPKDLSKYIKKGTSVKVGYINISKEKIAEFEDPEWEESDFESAQKTTIEIMEKIHNGVCWPPAQEVKFDNYKEYVNWLLDGNATSSVDLEE